jgi:cytochrome c
VEGDHVVGSIKNDSYLKFNDISLEGVKSIALLMYFGADYPYEGKVEIRMNSPNGPLIGESPLKYFSKEKGAKKNYIIQVEPTKDFDALYVVFKGSGDKEQIIGNFNAMILNY